MNSHNIISLHGVFMNIFGYGVLITGKSGIGKSEAALTLIDRGHSLVADDAVEFTRTSRNIIHGTCPMTLQNLLEVRGIGIINVRALLGDTAITMKQRLNLITHLEDIQNLSADNRRKGLVEKTEILGVNIHKITIPTNKERNIALLIETVTRSYTVQTKTNKVVAL